MAHKPVISYIIEKFDSDVEFVIALGYKGDTVKEYLTLAYPERTFHFQTIDKYKGKGSGLGYTMLKCRYLLQCPFIFCSNDTIVEEQIPPPSSNWMGHTKAGDTKNYRSLRVSNDRVTEICAKGAEGNVLPYIGLAGIYDFEEFWLAMSTGLDQGVVSIGETYGLRFLLDRQILAKQFSWHDTGNISALEDTRKIFAQNNTASILEKEDEAIWFVNNKVIKFSIDSKFISHRVKRAKKLTNFVPEITQSSKSMYAYGFIQGRVMSNNPNPAELDKLLTWLNPFWQDISLTDKQQSTFSSQCFSFYKDKTYQRVSAYFERFEQLDSEELVNGVRIPPIFDLLDLVNWDSLSEGIPSRIHGDLHFENIIAKESTTDPFVLIDWRQDFAGNLEFGDRYYDFAKLNHGLIICHELIDKNLFTVNVDSNSVSFDFLRKQSLCECEAGLRIWIEANGYDYNRVRLLTALVYLNIAALHHYPYSLLLFYLGKSMLYECLNNHA